MSDSGARGPYGAPPLFNLPSVRIALVIDAASIAISVALFVVTSNLFVFALPVLGAAWLAITILRARISQRTPPAAPADDQIVR